MINATDTVRLMQIWKRNVAIFYNIQKQTKFIPNLFHELSTAFDNQLSCLHQEFYLHLLIISNNH